MSVVRRESASRPLTGSQIAAAGNVAVGDDAVF
jgi:hypothetical protein